MALHYPGLNEFIFFRELQDLLRHSHPILELDDAFISLGSKIISDLEEAFLKGRPFSYLLHFAEFYGERFYIDERVLIPRSETEYMVELLLEKRRALKQPFRNVLDVGTGSGVILLSLMKQHFALKGTGCDISPDALAVARTNSLRLNADVSLIKSDRLSEIKESFEVIVSNPPYIKKTSHASGVHSGVDLHEPHLALYLQDETYQEWFDVFFKEVFEHLNPEGLFMMEGHEAELGHQAKMLSSIGFKNVSVMTDLTGRDRFLQGSRPKL